MAIHSACLPWSIGFCPSCPPSELSIGDRVLCTKSAGIQVSAKEVGFLQDGHVELEHDQGGVRVVNHLCPMDSFGIPSLESPPPSPSFLATGVSPEVPLDPPC